MNFTSAVYRQLMEKYWRRGINMGRTTPATPPETYFGFSAMDVEQMHYHMVGEGEGIWFRLLDGRVFDWQGRPSSPDRSLYDATIN